MSVHRVDAVYRKTRLTPLDSCAVDRAHGDGDFSPVQKDAARFCFWNAGMPLGVCLLSQTPIKGIIQAASVPF